MIRMPLLAALAVLTAAPSLPAQHRPGQAVDAHSYRPIERIGWAYDSDGKPDGPSLRLRFTHASSSSSVDADAVDVRAILNTIARAAANQPVTFSLAREAGTLACSGRAQDGGRGSGTCRFEPDDGWATQLARRGLAPKDADSMLALTLVDAHLATLDGLSADGFRFDDAGDLIAVSALGVTPAYAGELRGGGLKTDDLGDLIAARALKIDGAWLGEMAHAGYPDLAAGQAIQMRALGVTPGYARRMTRLLRAVGEIE